MTGIVLTGRGGEWMADVDEIIKSLEVCAKQIGKCSDCKYKSADKPMLICREMATDILDSMKKQKEEIAQLKVAFLTLPNWNPVVVRCKDCKYGVPLTDSSYIQCSMAFHTSERHGNDWFCADGVRKDREDT